MARPKACLRLSLTLLGLMLLSGCAGKPLIEREIVRAIFFAHSGQETRATLVLQDQQKEASDVYQTVSGTGKSPARALTDAVQSLDGTVFYGVMDTVGLPQDTDYAELLQYAELIHQTAQPSPEVSLLLLDDDSAAQLPDEAGKLYDAIRQGETRYDISCGLETIAAQQGTAAVPVWQDDPYGFAILSDGSAQYYRNAVSAQLAGILSRQTDRLDLIFGEGKYTCQADVSLVCRATLSEIQVLIQLKDAKLSALDPDFSGNDTDLQKRFTEELQSAFAQLTADSENSIVDPFRFQFWTKCLLGADASPLPVTLSVNYL